MTNNFFEVRMILAVMNAIYWRNCVTKPNKNDSGHQRGSNWPREARSNFKVNTISFHFRSV